MTTIEALEGFNSLRDHGGRLGGSDRAQRVRGEVIYLVFYLIVLKPVIRHLFEFCIFSLLVLLYRFSEICVTPAEYYGLTYAAGWHTREA